MRSGVLCTLLLVAGACHGLPQYGPGQQVQEQQQQSAVPVPVPVGGSVLTDAQKGDLEEFWWQIQGVFSPDGSAGGTQVVVQESTAGGSAVSSGINNRPFTPTPSPECGARQGCIPWQYCVNGVFTNTGDLAVLKSPTQVPDTYDSPILCGQLGNVCCNIPDDILAEQQQSSGGSGTPYTDGSAISGTGGIIEVESSITGSGTPYTDGSANPGTIVEQTSGGGGAIISGNVQIIETSPSGCPAYTHECVPHYQCTAGGEINTDGAGLIDVRIKPANVPVPTPCTNPEYPDVPGLCCRIPGATPPPTTVAPTPAPLQTCPGTQECVEEYQCNPDGNINTDGAGLINLRSKISCFVSYTDASTYVAGVCCQPPKPPHLETCPGTQVCVASGQCSIQSPSYDASSVNSCYYSPDQTQIGECCDPVPVTPGPLVTCPGDQDCVDISQCNADGTINTDGAGLINLRISQKACYLDAPNQVTGVCCRPPAPSTPAPLTTCPGDQVCTDQNTCSSQVQASGVTGVSYSTSCYIDPAAYTTGVCCPKPPPPTPAPLVTCPGTQVCASSNVCTSQVTATGGVPADYAKSCILSDDTYSTGVCCEAPPPSTCPGSQVCISQSACQSQSAAYGGISASSSVCYINPANYEVGVCCDPPIRVVDVCPGNSVCTPEVLCEGDILQEDDQYGEIGSGGPWSRCGLSGGLDSSGVCCLPKKPDLQPADRCGVRNYNVIDLRIQNKLQKNETNFGEFPWQGIIFFSNFTFKCGASIIGDKWLLTAAHCVHGYQYNDFKIRLGEWQVDKYDEPLPYVDAEIASITIHPDFVPGPVHNDIAVIELTAPVTFQYHINTICVPPANFQIPPGTRCFASGWGKDAFDGNYQPILKKISVPFVEHTYCQELLRKTRLGKYFSLHSSFMCAGGEENKDACEGDGGGPLICEDPNQFGTYYLYGITAWGINCGQKDVPGVYVDVSKFNSWVAGIIGVSTDNQQQVAGYGRK